MVFYSNKRTYPHYYNKVESIAKRRWEQLENDPGFAGPWHQLFAQIQSPRHVLSELLQNADDAKAEEASARIEGDYFIFEHNGEDFNEEQFTSLCQFGFSNKRKLHTIGFRGIGFKSIFSLGKVVQVLTPTLAVKFEANRFTLPEWIPDAPLTQLTQITVRIKDECRKQELEKNLQEWADSSTSLLFFNNICRLSIQDQVIRKKRMGTGPVPESDKIQLVGTETLDVIVFRSPKMEFPPETINEIQQERIVHDINLPPCQVELILGLKGKQKLYVILPTDISLSLPYSCNAPFIQDPARIGIKDPAISPTNRWLLKRLGQLAAMSMHSWLKDENIPMESRAQAYGILPCWEEFERRSLEESAEIIFESFLEGIPKDNLLSHTGELQSAGQCIAPPHELYGVWTPEQLLTIFGENIESVLAIEVLPDYRRRLDSLEWINVISGDDTLTILKTHRGIPKPNTFPSLSKFWHHVQNWYPKDWDHSLKKEIPMVPVEDEDHLFPTQSVVRVHSKNDKLSDDDWQFITGQLPILDYKWIEYLTLQKGETRFLTPEKESARQLLQMLGLKESTPIATLIAKAHNNYFLQTTISIEDRIRFAHIMACLDVDAPKGFLYVTRDGMTRSIKEGISADLIGMLEDLFPSDFAQQHLLHQLYMMANISCSQNQWNQWVSSSKSGLLSFIGFHEADESFWGETRLRKFLDERQGQMPGGFSIKKQVFKIEDWDFEETLLKHWHQLAAEDPFVWCRLVELIAEDDNVDWVTITKAKFFQVGNQNLYALSCGNIPAKWIARLRELPCLKDTHLKPFIPTDLLMRTPETEALMDIEPFVEHKMDNSKTKEFLKLLGVRETPTSLVNLFDRLRALSKSDQLHLLDVAKWYSRLDQILPRCNTDEIEAAKRIFAAEKLIISSENEWCSSNEVFQYSEENDIPGVPILHPEIRHFSLWNRLGVAERPTHELVLSYLSKIESNHKIEGVEQKRVRSFLKRIPVEVWTQCEHWLSLENVWTPITKFEFKISMRQLTPFTELFPGVRSRTADIRMLSFDYCDQFPFNTLKNLGDVIDNRIMEVERTQTPPISKGWINTLGKGLKRIKLPDEGQTVVVRRVAARLEKTKWQRVKNLKVVPYILGTPSGQGYFPDVHWQDDTLYVTAKPLVKIFKQLVEIIAEPFQNLQIADAIRSCVDRDEEFVKEYVNCNFELDDSPLEDHYAPEVNTRIPLDSNEDSDFSSENETSDMVGPEDDWGKSTAYAVEETKEGMEGDSPSNGKPIVRIQKRSLIDRYAEMLGFQYNTRLNRYVHANGTWLQKSDGIFNWELCDCDGNVVCSFWVSEQCLQTKGVEIQAPLWEMIKKSPKESALILLDINDEPVKLDGVDLFQKVTTSRIKLFPAKYRLRLADIV